MRKILLIALLTLGAATVAHADDMTPYAQMPAGDYVLDKTHASLTWKVSHMGMSYYTARFTGLDAKIHFDPADPTSSNVVVHVDPMSIRTDYPNAAEKNFDKELSTSAQWFNAGKFPRIEFISTKIVRTGEDTADITGNLTLLGVTKPLTLHAKLNGAYAEMPMMKVPAMGFSATATLKRSEWGMGQYVPMVGDDVTLLIETEFHMPQQDSVVQ